MGLDSGGESARCSKPSPSKVWSRAHTTDNLNWNPVIASEGLVDLTHASRADEFAGFISIRQDIPKLESPNRRKHFRQGRHASSRFGQRLCPSCYAEQVRLHGFGLGMGLQLEFLLEQVLLHSQPPLGRCVAPFAQLDVVIGGLGPLRQFRHLRAGGLVDIPNYSSRGSGPGGPAATQLDQAPSVSLAGGKRSGVKTHGNSDQWLGCFVRRAS